jgi:hypothetical protein
MSAHASVELLRSLWTGDCGSWDGEIIVALCDQLKEVHPDHVAGLIYPFKKLSDLSDEEQNAIVDGVLLWKQRRQMRKKMEWEEAAA